MYPIDFEACIMKIEKTIWNFLLCFWVYGYLLPSAFFTNFAAQNFKTK